MLKNKQKLRVLFMGTPEFSAKILEALLDDHYNIIGTFTQTDKKVGRKQTLQKSPVKTVAEKNNIPIFTPIRLNAEAIEKIQELQPDLIILVAYGKILPQAVLDLPRLGAVNIHPSLLPKFRGPSPIQNALLAGEKNTGTTIMLMDAGIDTGNILRQKEINIEKNDTYLELADKLAQLSAELLLKTLHDFLAGKVIPKKQNNASASYCQMIKKSDGQIDWQDLAENIYNKYRAFFVWPGSFALWQVSGQLKRIKLNKISLAEKESVSHQTGEVFQTDNGIFVQAKNGTIKLAELQIEGKPSTTTQAFINGHKNFIGSILS
jgi:methionyl-tRNA formyltransferase